MTALIFVGLLALHFSQAIVIEQSPPTNGVEVSITEWYGESTHSLKIQETKIRTNDPQCNLIMSFVKSMLFIKRVQGVLSEDQSTAAWDHFENCLSAICGNQAMMDAFQNPNTFKEQMNILIAQAKMSEWSGKKDKTMVLKYLVNAKYKDIYGDSFPPTLSEKDKTHDAKSVSSVIGSVCSSQPDAGGVAETDLPLIALYSLVDRYVDSAVTEDDILQLTHTFATAADVNEVWERIADRVLSPTSNFAATCLDPALAAYSPDRPSVTRIKVLATTTMAIDCGLDIPISGPESGPEASKQPASESGSEPSQSLPYPAETTTTPPPDDDKAGSGDNRDSTIHPDYDASGDEPRIIPDYDISGSGDSSVATTAGPQTTTVPKLAATEFPAFGVGIGAGPPTAGPPANNGPPSFNGGGSAGPPSFP